MDRRDAETANDPTLFRMNNACLHRWLSPDRLAGDISNPQSLNRYAYVLNNPTNFIDPLGLQQRDPEERQERIEEIIQRVGMMEARGASFMVTGCRLDGVPINCGVLAQAIRAGMTNVEPIFSSGATLTGWVPSGINLNIVGYIPGSDIPVYTLSPVYSLYSFNLVAAGPGPFGGTVPRVNRRKAGNELETLVVGLNALTTPLQNLVVSGGFLVTGTTLIGTGIGLIGAGCFGSGGLACGAAIYGAGTAFLGSGISLTAGYEYTRRVTIPSFVGLYEGLVPRH